MVPYLAFPQVGVQQVLQSAPFAKRCEHDAVIREEVQHLCVQEQAAAGRWKATLQDFADVEFPGTWWRLYFQGLTVSGSSRFLLAMQLSNL